MGEIVFLESELKRRLNTLKNAHRWAYTDKQREQISEEISKVESELHGIMQMREERQAKLF